MTARSSHLNGERITLLPEDVDLAVCLEGEDKLDELRLEIYTEVTVHADGN
jgi:hypothetical protein